MGVIVTIEEKKQSGAGLFVYFVVHFLYEKNAIACY